MLGLYNAVVVWKWQENVAKAANRGHCPKIGSSHTTTGSRMRRWQAADGRFNGSCLVSPANQHIVYWTAVFTFLKDLVASQTGRRLTRQGNLRHVVSLAVVF